MAFQYSMAHGGNNNVNSNFLCSKVFWWGALGARIKQKLSRVYLKLSAIHYGGEQWFFASLTNYYSFCCADEKSLFWHVLLPETNIYGCRFLFFSKKMLRAKFALPTGRWRNEHINKQHCWDNMCNNQHGITSDTMKNRIYFPFKTCLTMADIFFSARFRRWKRQFSGTHSFKMKHSSGFIWNPIKVNRAHELCITIRITYIEHPFIVLCTTQPCYAM